MANLENLFYDQYTYFCIFVIHLEFMNHDDIRNRLQQQSRSNKNSRLSRILTLVEVEFPVLTRVSSRAAKRVTSLHMSLLTTWLNSLLQLEYRLTIFQRHTTAKTAVKTATN